jgi:hypothetical protein
MKRSQEIPIKKKHIRIRQQNKATTMKGEKLRVDRTQSIGKIIL